TSYEVKNAHVFGDGFNILAQNVPFASVSSNSVIAGIVVRANVKITGNAENKKIAGLVGQNDGFIYSCNVTGGSAIYGQGTSFDDTMGSIVANAELVAGLVAQNSGTIKDCYTYVNVNNTAKNASEGKNISDYISGGLVANNEGLIFSSYTSGQVTTAGATLYAFSNGNVFDCYTISKVVGIEDEAIDMYAFDDDAQVVGSYYDVYATERGLNEKYYSITDHIMGYSALMPNEGEADSEVLGNNSRQMFLNQMINIDEKTTNNNVFEFSVDKKYNYGYAYFGANGYSNIDYMHHQTYTDNGTESVAGDDIYQIPNIGVLEQLRYSKFNDKNYVLVNDIEFINLKLNAKDVPIFPSFDFAGKLDGIWGDPNNKSINNLKVVKGLFGNITETGKVSNISLNNFVINNSVESSADNNGNYNCGILAAQNFGEINSVSVKYDKICEDFEYFESQNNKTIADTFSLGLIAGNNIGSINNSCVTIEEVENAQFIVRTDFPGGEYKNFGTIAGISSGNINNCWFSGKLFTAFGENYEQDNADVEIHNQGGIVGKVTSGKVELCYLSTNASVNFLTGDAEVEDKNAVNMTGKTLNAGGIVGFVNGGQIEKCYTIGGNESKNTEIRGGNKYSIEISYVGGICGLIESGTLNACYNKADVTAYARVQYIQDSWSSVTVEYDELLYAKYNELAYGAGIANGIKIEVTESDGTKTANANATESINYGKVKGGVYVETIMGFFDFNDELLALRPLIFTAAVRTGVGFIKIGISLCSNPYTLGAGIAKIAIGTGIIAVAAAQVFVPTPVYGYYTKYNTDHLNYMENLEGGGLDYFHGAQASYEDVVGDFKKSLGDALKNLVNFNVINQLLNAMPPRLATNFIYHYSGEFDIADIASFDFGILSFSIGGFVRDVEEHFSGEWAGIKFKDGYAYYEEQSFAPGVPIVQNHLYVYDSYYNGISNNVNGTNYNPENDELAKLYDNSAHNYYTKPLGEYSDHHYLNSNSGDNKLLYKLSYNYDVNKKFSKNIDITEKPSEDWTFDDDSEKWVLVDGKEGQTVQFAKLKLELKDEMVVITVDEEISLKTVGQIITNFENYAQKNEGQINTATNLTLDQFKEYIESGNYEIYVAKNIIVTMPWSPIAKDVENVHSYFNGSINGDNNSIEINSVYTTNNEIAFIANSQNAKIRNLNVDIKIEYVSEETQQKTIAAFIANAEGETKIENCQANVEIYDYVEGNEAEDIEEKVSSSAKIGGLVGMANGIVAGEKANISVTSSSVSGTIHSKANKGTNGLIGGVVGSTNIGSTIKLEELETSIQINAEKSTNITAGGLIAEVKETTNEIVISDVVVNDNVVVLAKENSDYVYVGGIIGKANIKYEQQININNCNIECCQISGDVITENHGTTYVGGLIGLLESTGSASISACKLGKNSEELALKLYISSGFVENTKPTTAYVGDYVGFGVYEIGNGMKFNAKSIAIASYRYQYNNDIDFNNSNQNETLAINVATNGQVINHVGDIVNKENDAVTNGTYLMTIKTNKQYCTNFDNSYVNQQPGFGFYNYKQTYYIIYASVEYTSNNAEIKDEYGAKKNSYEIKSGDAHIDKNSELFKYYEKVYKLDVFYGLGVGNSEYDSNYVVNYNFDSIVENCYMLDKNIYKSDLWKVENRSLEESTLFMPKLDKVGYYVTNNGIVQGTIGGGETYDTYEYCSINS
ncbi:MAG: hypothetical protein IJA69_06465, partial [Clostridia bacterium]|nr:hypothetical protein [Clostridia bacterium]